MVRVGFTAAVLFALLLATAPLASAESSATPSAAVAGVAKATEPIERLYAALLEAMQRADALGVDGRAQLLGPAIDAAYNLEFMAAKVLGRSWKSLSEGDRVRWQDAFRRLTVSTYAHRFDGFSGERFEVLGGEPAARDTVVVRTRIVRSKEDPVELDYRMGATGDIWRIIDVYLNGTVSELALRRSEYSSVLKREGFESLLAAIEEKIANPVE